MKISPMQRRRIAWFMTGYPDVTQADLAKLFGVARTTITAIKSMYLEEEDDIDPYWYLLCEQYPDDQVKRIDQGGAESLPLPF